MGKHALVSVPTLLLLLFASAEKVTPADEAGSCVIRGKAVFEGKAPRRKRIKMVDADPKCEAVHADAPALFETVVVGDDGALQNVFVYVKEGLGDQKFDVPTEPVMLDQKGCQYHPHVFGIQVKQPLEIFNSDPTTHNIRSLAKAGSFNIGMPAKEEPWSVTKKFRKAEPAVVAKVKCEIHAWMSAYVGILPHPFFSVSGGRRDVCYRSLVPRGLRDRGLAREVRDGGAGGHGGRRRGEGAPLHREDRGRQETRVHLAGDVGLGRFVATLAGVAYPRWNEAG